MSLVGVIIAIDLAGKGLTPVGIGLVIGAGVAGSAAGTVLVGLWADSWGRRRTLVGFGILAGVGYAALAATSSLAALAIVSFFGMVNGMGRDRGAASALDQAILPTIVTDNRRTWALAWYNATIDTGHAVGALGAIIPTLVATTFALTMQRAHELTLLLCGAVVIVASLAYAGLSGDTEVRSPVTDARHRPHIDANTRRTVRKIALLFGVDSVGGGFLSSSLVAYWFFERYGTSEVQLAMLFFGARTLNVLSHIAAAWLARRIGLLNTMVFTHLPSSVLLMLAPTASSAPLAAALFLAREALVEMDVPTRQSYVMAVVPASARTYASGMTNVTRNIGWAVGPLLGGPAMQQIALAAPLLIGGTLKIAYDLALYRSFRHLRPPEESSVVALT